MISKIGFRIFGIIVKCGHWAGVTRHKWDNENLQITVSTSRMNIVRYYSNLLLGIISLPIVLAGYVMHLRRFGFSLSDVKNIFQFFYICVFCLLYLFQYGIFSKTKTVTEVINQLCYFFKHVSETYSLGSSGRDYCVVFFGSLLAGGLTVPSFFVVIYLFRCELHPFYEVLPIVCARDVNLTGLDKILIKTSAGLTVWTLGTSIFFSGLIAVYPTFLFWFHGLDLAQTMRKEKCHHPKNRKNFITILKCLEVLKYRVDYCNGPILLPGYFFALMLAYLMAFNSLLKGDIGPMATSAFLDVSLIFLATYAIQKISWMSLHVISEMIQKCRHTAAGGLERRQLDSCSPIVLRFGQFGSLDRDMYIFVGDFVISSTIDILLM